MKSNSPSWKVVLVMAIFAGSMLVAGGCSGQGTEAPKAKALEIGQDANGKVIDVGAAETVSIKLRENASTGYQWIVASVDGTSVKSTDDVKHEADPKQDIRPGSAGDYYADFRVVGSGKTKVTLEYRRPWEKDKAPAETFSVTFNVVGGPSTQATTVPATTHPAK